MLRTMRTHFYRTIRWLLFIFLGVSLMNYGALFCLSPYSVSKVPTDENAVVPALKFENYKSRFPIPDWMEEFLTTQPIHSHNASLMDPNQKFVVMTCHRYDKYKAEDCGGITDRLKTVPYWLWVAKNSGRKLLIKYSKPHPLEDFLVPPADSQFDWRLPDGYFDKEFDAYANRTHSQYMSMRRYNWHTMMHTEPWNSTRVIFVNNNLAMGGIMENMKERIGMNETEIVPGLFRRMFQPSPAVERIIQDTARKHHLIAGQYAAAHLRLRWPKTPPNRLVLGKNRFKADKEGGGLLMEFNLTRWNVHILSHNAINCAMQIMPDAKVVYFASDANEAAQYLVHESPWSPNALANTSLTTEVILNKVPKIASRLDIDKEPVHFDSQSKRFVDPSEMYSGFVDLWIMGHAKCITHGLGGYARYGAALAGIYETCRYKTWLNKDSVVQYCPEYLNQLGMTLKPRLVIPH